MTRLPERLYRSKQEFHIGILAFAGIAPDTAAGLNQLKARLGLEQDLLAMGDEKESRGGHAFAVEGGQEGLAEASRHDHQAAPIASGAGHIECRERFELDLVRYRLRRLRLIPIRENRQVTKLRAPIVIAIDPGIIEPTNPRMGDQRLELGADLVEWSTTSRFGIAEVIDPIVPLKSVGKCRAADVAGADEGAAPDLASVLRLNGDVGFEMEALLAGLEDANIGAALAEQHQPTQGLRLGDVEVVAGQDAQTCGAELNGVGERIEDERQTA
jgi:hypothetical protein